MTNRLPDNTKSILPSVGINDDQNPSTDWSDDELGNYAQQQDEQYKSSKKRMAIHRYREGLALSLAHGRIFGTKGRGAWGVFLQSHGISHSSDGRARELYAKVKSEDDLDGLRIMEAYKQFGIEKTHEKKSVDMDKKPLELTGQHDDHIPQGNDETMKKTAIQHLSVADPWIYLQEVVGVLGLKWSDVVVWAKQQEAMRYVANIVVNLEPTTVLIGGRAEISYAVDATEELCDSIEQSEKASLSNPSTVQLNGKSYEIACVDDQWFRVMGNELVSCSPEFVKIIEEQLAVSTTQAA